MDFLKHGILKETKSPIFVRTSLTINKDRGFFIIIQHQLHMRHLSSGVRNFHKKLLYKSSTTIYEAFTGPCTPTTKSISISAELLGPVI